MLRKFLQPGLFTLAGGLAGWLYYTLKGCTTGCPIASSPTLSILYLGLVGFLLSFLFREG